MSEGASDMRDPYLGISICDIGLDGGWPYSEAAGWNDLVA